MVKSSPDHEGRRKQVEDTIEWLLHRAQPVWEHVAPHPAIESHPLLTLLGVIAMGLYWVLGTPVSDVVVFLSRLTTAGEAIWSWALPAPVQSLFLEYPAIHLLAVLLAIGAVIHVRNQGIGHVVTEEVVPLIKGFFSAIGTVIAVAVSALVGVVAENRDVIKDVVVNVVSSWIFWVLVALGIVGASLSGLLDVVDTLPL